MPTGIAENIDEKLRGAVDHQMLLGEIEIAIDEASDFENALDTGKRTEFLAYEAEHIGCAERGGFFCGVQRNLRRDFPLADQVFVAVEGNAAGDIDRASVDDDGAVGCAGCEFAIEGVAEGLEFFVRTHFWLRFFERRKG